jgi:hypothetical protein
VREEGKDRRGQGRGEGGGIESPAGSAGALPPPAISQSPGIKCHSWPQWEPGTKEASRRGAAQPAAAGPLSTPPSLPSSWGLRARQQEGRAQAQDSWAPFQESGVLSGTSGI